MASTKSKSRRTNDRTRIVWGALLASMTLVGGVLLAVDHQGAPSIGGLAIPTLASISGPDTVDAVFRTTAPLADWKAIVIHDSGSVSGSAATLDEQARRQGLRGMGYGFVIGNGSGLGDGELFVGERWLAQTPGAHTAGPNSDWYNRNAIGICLVGDGQRRPFTQAQLRRLVQLVDALSREFKLPADHVFLHSQLADTPSPGKFFPDEALRAQLGGSR